MTFNEFKTSTVLPNNIVLGVIFHVEEDNSIKLKLPFLRKGKTILHTDKYDDLNVIDYRISPPLIAVNLTDYPYDFQNAVPA